ncbi:hypothetical protein AAG570_002968, partial [Ranatra chinensis]
VLSGSGVYDGSEIHEAVSVLSHLTRNGAVPVAFAPDIPQYHVVNHLNGSEDTTHSRNVLAESARIARGQVKPICDLVNNMDCYDAVIFPGGFGCAKNLSDFAIKGTYCTVIPEVVEILKGFHCKKKPIGLACIAPILAARVLCNVTITLGRDLCEKWPYRDVIKQAKEMGATLDDRDWNEVCFDKENMIFSTPAYMYEGLYHEIDDGIGILVKYIITVLKKGIDQPSVQHK